MIVLKNARLISCLTEGYEGQNADIVINGKEIAEIVPCGSKEYGDVTCYDLQGKTVMPGLFDLHAHLFYMNDNWEYLRTRPVNQYLMECAEYARAYLKLGYTTIRDVGGDFGAAITVRDYVASGLLTGARVIASGKIIAPTEKGNYTWGNVYHEADDPVSVRKAVREEIAAGADFIKYMATGAVLNQGSVPGVFISSAEELQAVVEAAESRGTYVASHCHGTQGINECIKAGIRTIEHSSYMTEESVELIVKYGNRTAIVPTLAGCHMVSQNLTVLPEEYMIKCRHALNHMGESVRLSLEGGVLIGFGTDLPMVQMLKHPGIEFAARTPFGFSNETLLQQATINSAKIAGVADKLGTVCVGKYADLLVIDGKPDVDITCMQKFPNMVFKEGKLFTE